jgi:hypothetical protein
MTGLQFRARIWLARALMSVAEFFRDLAKLVVPEECRRRRRM